VDDVRERRGLRDALDDAQPADRLFAAAIDAGAEVRMSGSTASAERLVAVYRKRVGRLGAAAAGSDTVVERLGRAAGTRIRIATARTPSHRLTVFLDDATGRVVSSWAVADPLSTTVAPMAATWPTTVHVAPSILSADFGRMREQVAEVMDAGARVIHVDVMDGHFVPVITFGPKMLADIADVIHEHGGLADVHLMIEQPERHLAQFAEAGADSITVHVETCPHLHHTLAQIGQLGCRAGATLNPATPVHALSEAARYADVLLCMSVNPGWGGQAFIPASLERLGRLRGLVADRAGVAIEVDGGIHTRTVADAYRAGANILVAGSAVFSAPSPGEAYRELVELVTAAEPATWV